MVRVFVNNKEMTICNLYIPPKFDNDTLLNELEKLKNLLQKPFIITTDFNAHHYPWGSNHADFRGKLLMIGYLLIIMLL